MRDDDLEKGVAFSDNKRYPRKVAWRKETHRHTLSFFTRLWSPEAKGVSASAMAPKISHTG